MLSRKGFEAFSGLNGKDCHDQLVMSAMVKELESMHVFQELAIYDLFSCFNIHYYYWYYF